MGTSSSFKGGNGSNPLIPSWLDATSGAPDSAPGDDAGPYSDGVDASDPAQSQEPGNGADPGGPTDEAPTDRPAGEATPNRFTGPRRVLNKLARTGGAGDGAKLRRAVGSYVRGTAGGAATAARRMSSERSSTARFSGILSQAGEVGIRAVIRTLNLGRLADRPLADIYAALVDVVCAPGGPLDEAFSREAYIEAVIEVTALDLPDLEHPSPDTIAIFLSTFMTNAIHARILNAIGNRMVELAPDLAAVHDIGDQLKDFIRGAVDNALAAVGNVIPVNDMRATIDAVYLSALTILQGPSEQGGQP